MSDFDSSNAFPSNECQQVLSAVTSFFQKLHENEWLSQSSKEEIKSCLHSARNIEKILDGLQSNGSLEDFLDLLPDLYGHNLDQISKPCDIILCMILTASGTPLPCVRVCIDEYLKLCGSERFEVVLASVIFSSEILRVLLDTIASSSDHSLESYKISFQSQVFRKLWKSETNSTILKDKFFKWLKSDLCGNNIAVAMQVVSSENSNSLVSSCLVHSLVRVLQERGDAAVLFWKIFNEHHMIRKATLNSNELLTGIMEFLKTSGKWMEATASLSWISREEGPCKVVKFEELKNIIKLLWNIGGPVQNKVEQFLLKQRNSEGCTFWDDIDMQLNK
ncbi:Myoglobin [Frankliniella fusca]|uniref:Myoglobin n=1 Tax=Frankliniella fusca TaxID=407009 RepID=A0AAE1I178_9NEOP|nr:Myoglobin [Frankliniella fusca]